MPRVLADERAELRARQGAGARYDAASAPARELDWARRGTAYFARILNGLDDGDLAQQSSIPDLSRKQIVAYIGLEARALGELIGWLRAGGHGPSPPHPTPAADRMIDSVTLPVRALRNLFSHSAVHLDVEWRDLSDAQWDLSLQFTNGSSVKVRETPLQRAMSLWSSAVDLRAGGRFSDIPDDVTNLLGGRTERLRSRYRVGMPRTEA